ncbi:MAG: hypothetical protein AAFY65_05150 [Pseudomonadota bacterium]
MIPGPMDVFRVLPKLGLNLVVPALVIGAVMGSMVDVILGSDGYPVAMLGTLLGPLGFALGINALDRAARLEVEAPDPDAYRRAETEKRKQAAHARGELVNLDEHRDVDR